MTKRIPTRWLVIGFMVLALLFGIARALINKRAQQQAASAPPTTQTMIEIVDSDVVNADNRTLTQGLDISGTVKAVNYAVIKARVPGELKNILVREGDAVKAGQALAQIDPMEYQHRWQQAQEQAEAAKAQFEIAQRQWNVNQSLVDQGFISKLALDNSQASFQGAMASYKAAMAGADVARKSLADATLVAPFTGVVAARMAQVGERMPIDAKILELVDPSNLEVEVPLSASDSIDVRVGQVASLQIEDRKEVVSAKVKRIAPSAQAGTRSVMIYLGLEKPQGLRHGLFAKGLLGLNQAQVVAVPLSSVRTDKPAPYVQVVEKIGDVTQVSHRPVTIGLRGLDPQQPDSEMWVGVSGLTPGSQVLRGQLGTLREGLQVKYTHPSAPASPTAASSTKPASAASAP